MRKLVGVAEQLRLVRNAGEHFYWRGTLEQVVIEADVLDRLARDVELARREDASADESTSNDRLWDVQD